MMRAALFVDSAELEIVDDVDIDVPRRDQVRVKVNHCGICHSDYSLIVSGYSPSPLILGHEAAGTVEAVGPDVHELAVGDKVVLSPTVACGRCRACLRGQPALCAGNKAVFASTFVDGETGLSRGGKRVYRGMNVGGFAEAALVTQAAAVKVAADTPLEIACVLGCAVQTGVGAALNTADIVPGDTVVVLGAGGIGLSVVQGARIAGAARIVLSDPIAERRELAAKLGATDLIDPEADDLVGVVRDLTEGEGADTVFEASGVGALQRVAISATRPGGTTVLVGAPPGDHTLKIPAALLWGMSEKKLVGCFMGSSNARRDIPRFLDMWRAGQLDLQSMITSRRPVEDVNAGLADLVAGVGVRTIIEF
ncbi:Zn-dependent alcohol dehydrogenase [Mycobacterium sp. NPDC051804]|uniref:Zn-dependent alcohol dehydrogenase n=1 Tax=Mycobacterium sp. NPDC051804 TaxID=3364295 RepID=UPI00379025D0